LVSFAKTGDPNGGNRPHWPRNDPAVDQVINFTNNGAVVGPDPLKKRLDLWRKVWSQNQ
jgi:para-nitrobenzyl esterase